MATQGSNGKIKGKINNIVYRQLGSKQVMQTAPTSVKQTDATKLHALEFGVASAHGKVIRTIFQKEYEVSDGKMNARLNAAIGSCLRTADKEVGERTLHDANLDDLKGFEFNLDAPIASRIAARPTCTVDADGTFHFHLPSFNTCNDIAYPSADFEMDAKLTVGLVAIQFEEEYVQVIDYETFRFKNLDEQLEINWQCQKQLPKDFITLVFLSLRYSTTNWVGREISTTDRTYIPTVLLDAFHVSEEMALAGKNAGFELPTGKNERMGFMVTKNLSNAKRFKEKMADKRK